jgi:hypothetical protein
VGIYNKFTGAVYLLFIRSCEVSYVYMDVMYGFFVTSCGFIFWCSLRIVYLKWAVGCKMFPSVLVILSKMSANATNCVVALMIQFKDACAVQAELRSCV